MNNHIRNFKNRIFVALALLPSLTIAQEIETNVFGFGPTVLEMHGQPAVSEKSNSNEKNTIFYEANITINYHKLHPDQAVTQTNIYAEKAELLLMDNKGRPLAIILQNATIENNIMSSFAKEAMILPDSDTIKFLTDKVDLLSTKTTSYTCEKGRINITGNESKFTQNFTQVGKCDNNVITNYSCTGGIMAVSQTVSVNACD